MRVDPALEVSGEVAAVFALQVWALPVAAAARAMARAPSALAPHRLVVVIEQRIVAAQFLTGADVAKDPECRGYPGFDSGRGGLASL